jgi:serine/threonine-protein kinase RsbT
LRLAVRRGEPGVQSAVAAVDVDGSPAEPTLTPNIIEVRVRIDSEEGLVEARRQSRNLTRRGGFREADRAIIAAIVSELARNMLRYAACGDMVMKLFDEAGRVGICIAAQDQGPGIPDVGTALRDGYSTSGRLGVGLPGVRRLADHFQIEAGASGGTIVRVRRWRR